MMGSRLPVRYDIVRGSIVMSQAAVGKSAWRLSTSLLCVRLQNDIVHALWRAVVLLSWSYEYLGLGGMAQFQPALSAGLPSGRY